jgi:uncharacterized protein (DUF2249 family)
MPDIQLHPATAAIVEVDARDDLRSGREPFSRIIAAVNALKPDEVLRVRAIFEPVPLFNALGKRGFAHESNRHAVDDWSAWFWRADVEWLDVRGREPPEPLVRTLAALDSLPAGHTLIHVNVRVPQLLLPMLVERGYAFEVDESRAGEVLVRISRR